MSVRDNGLYTVLVLRDYGSSKNNSAHLDHQYAKMVDFCLIGPHNGSNFYLINIVGP